MSTDYMTLTDDDLSIIENDLRMCRDDEDYENAAFHHVQQNDGDTSLSVAELPIMLVTALRAERIAHQQTRKACLDLLAGRLSTSTGGDPGMVFDSFDRATEDRRRGIVKFDLDHVERFHNHIFTPKDTR